jgi:hypothetical protein
VDEAGLVAEVFGEDEFVVEAGALSFVAGVLVFTDFSGAPVVDTGEADGVLATETLEVVSLPGTAGGVVPLAEGGLELVGAAEDSEGVARTDSG